MSNTSKLIAQAKLGSIQPVTDARTPENLDNATVLSTLETWMSDILGMITVLATLFFIVYAFLAAFDWITAGGDKGKIDKAKDRLVWSTLGLILMIASYAIIGLIGGIIGLDILNPASMLETVIPGGGNI